MKKNIKFGGTIVALLLSAVLSVTGTTKAQTPPGGAAEPCLLENLPEGYSLARDTSICEGSPVCLEHGAGVLSASGYTRRWTVYKSPAVYDDPADNITVEPRTNSIYFWEIIRNSDRCIRRDTVYIKVQARPKVWMGKDTVHICTEGDVELRQYVDSITGSIKSGSYYWDMWPETWRTLVDTPSSWSNMSTGYISNATTFPAVFEPKFHKPWNDKTKKHELVMDSSIAITFRLKVDGNKLCADVVADDTIVIVFSPKSSVTNLTTTSSVTACITDPTAGGDIFVGGLHRPYTADLNDDIDCVRFSYDPGTVTPDFVWKPNARKTDSVWSVRLRYRHTGSRENNVIYRDTVYVRDINGCEAVQSYQVEFVGWPRVLPDTVPVCPGEEARISLSYPSSSTAQWYNTGDNAYAASGNVVQLSPSQTTTYRVSSLKAKACTGLPEDFVTVKVFPKPVLYLQEPIPYVNNIQTVNVDSTLNINRIEWLANGIPAGEGPVLTYHLFENTVFTAKGITTDGCAAYDSAFIFFFGRKTQTAIGKENYQRMRADLQLRKTLEGAQHIENTPAGTPPGKIQTALGREQLERYIEDLEILLEAARKQLENY